MYLMLCYAPMWLTVSVMWREKQTEPHTLSHTVHTHTRTTQLGHQMLEVCCLLGSLICAPPPAAHIDWACPSVSPATVYSPKPTSLSMNSGAHVWVCVCVCVCMRVRERGSVLHICGTEMETSSEEPRANILQLLTFHSLSLIIYLLRFLLVLMCKLVSNFPLPFWWSAQFHRIMWSINIVA